MIGAAPLLLQAERSAVILGCSCGRSFYAACSIVVEGAGQHLRADLMTEDAHALADVAEGYQQETSQRFAVWMRREGPDCILVIDGVRVLLRGPKFLALLGAELRRRTGRLLVSARGATDA